MTREKETPLSSEELRRQIEETLKESHSEMNQMLEENGVLLPENAKTPQEARARWISVFCNSYTKVERRKQAKEKLQRLTAELPSLDVSSDNEILVKLGKAQYYYAEVILNPFFKDEKISLAQDNYYFIAQLRSNAPDPEIEIKLRALFENRKTFWDDRGINPFIKKGDSERTASTLKFIQEAEKALSKDLGDN